MIKRAICLPLEEFIAQAPDWHREYLEVDARRGREGKRTVDAVEKLIQQSRNRGTLDIADIEEVVRWGGGSRLLGRIKRNKPEHIEDCTSQAIKSLDKPADALEYIRRIDGLGESFGSKILAFLSSATCPVLDSVVRDCLSKVCNWDNASTTYSDFIVLCEYIAKRLPPEWTGRQKDGVWYLRDIEMALFQFAWREKGIPKTYITGTLPF